MKGLIVTGKKGLGEVPLGATGTFTKTVSESGVYLNAGITGDLYPNQKGQIAAVAVAVRAYVG